MQKANKVIKMSPSANELNKITDSTSGSIVSDSRMGNWS